MTINELDLFEQFARIEWLLKRYNQQNKKSHGPMSDPHRGQGRILTMLKLQPEISQKELSFLLDIRPQSLGELLGKLERGGYITRTPSEKDRRIMEIHLTEKGLEAANPQSDLDKLLNCLSDDEKLNLDDYLSRLIEALEAKLNNDEQEASHEDFDFKDEPKSNKDDERKESAWNFDPCNFGANFNEFMGNLHDSFDHNFDPKEFGDRIRSTFDSTFDPEAFKDNLKETFGTDFDLRTFMDDNFPHFDSDFMENLWNPGKKDETNTEDDMNEADETDDTTVNEEATSIEPQDDLEEEASEKNDDHAEDVKNDTSEN